MVGGAGVGGLGEDLDIGFVFVAVFAEVGSVFSVLVGVVE